MPGNNDDTFTYEDIVEAKKLLDDIPVPTFAGLPVIMNPMLGPEEVVIMVGPEYYRRMQKEKAKTQITPFNPYDFNCMT